MPYLGKTPSQATRKRYYKTASAGDTSVSGTMTVGGTLTFTDGEFVDVSVNGVALVAGTDYNTDTANTIAGLSALAANDQVEIVVYDTFSVFGGSFNGDISLGDNVKAKFGAGDDLQISHDGSTSLIVDAGTGNLVIAADELILRNAANNEAKADFTTDGAANLYFDNAVKLSTASGGIDITGSFTATDGCTITTADNDAQLILKSTDADGSLGPKLDLTRDSSSPADGDNCGQINFKIDNDAGESTQYGDIFVGATDVSDGSESAHMTFSTMKGGSRNSRMKLHSDETVFNEDSVDVDFRVEGNGNANMLFVDAGNDRVGIGTSSPQVALHVDDSSSSGKLRLSKGTVSSADDGVGSIQFRTGNTTAAANINGRTDTSGTGNGAIQFSTGTTSSLNERMRITSNGDVLIASQGTSSNSLTVQGSAFVEANANHQYLKVSHTSTNSGEALIYLNRHSSDGQLIQFRQANSSEGNISVSGTTVSYNGGHLSRWSRLADDSKDTSILKGTVMTNLDKMVVWHHEAKEAMLYKDGDEIPEGKKVGDEKTPAVEAYDEDNEQLNCMAVSSVEGDINVAGVFVNWDESDDYNDMNVAMTGDMVIRIAKDTTVARGNLLMSAGDGTAKPQGDGYVQDKTIAKVTSTTKSHTYDDGSYLVPCVLMAC